jgi:hypothetical protein
MFRVYYTDTPLPNSLVEPNFAMLMPWDRSSEKEAIDVAMQLLGGGASVWRIQKPDGRVISRGEISAEYFRRNLRWPNEYRTQKPA